MMATIATGWPTLNGAGLLRQDRVQILGKQPMVFPRKLYNLRHFLHQIIWSNGGLPSMGCGNRIEPVPFSAKQRGKPHFSDTESLGRKVFAVRFHSPKNSFFFQSTKSIQTKPEIFDKMRKSGLEKRLIFLFCKNNVIF
jgi:hypothetical protein